MQAHRDPQHRRRVEGPPQGAVRPCSQVLESNDSTTVTLELTRKTDLAPQALRTLVREDAMHKGGELADAVVTSAAFLAQVLAPCGDRPGASPARAVTDA
jgi:5-enolpyruvylshikimate-3-phosphate synthase